ALITSLLPVTALSRQAPRNASRQRAQDKKLKTRSSRQEAQDKKLKQQARRRLDREQAALGLAALDRLLPPDPGRGRAGLGKPAAFLPGLHDAEPEFARAHDRNRNPE